MAGKLPAIRKYTLIGALSFPIDMLRYDAAWPATEQDSQLIERTIRHSHADIEGTSTVEVFATRDLTVDRWRSFGWFVESMRR